MSREIVKVFCLRNHRVGTVTADAGGLAVDYVAEVWHTTGIFGSPSTMRLDEDDVTEFAAYCNICRKSVHLTVPGLRAPARARCRDLRAPYRDTSDKMWTDAGYPPMYPPGTGRFNNDPRSSE